MKSKFISPANFFISIIFIFSMLFISKIIKAQVIKAESFDNNFTGTFFPNNELPFGWTQGKELPSTDTNNAWDRSSASSSINPVCPTHSGIGMVRFRSGHITTAGEKGFIVSRPYDLSERPVGTPSNVRFWLYREATAGTNYIKVYANNVPDLISGTPVLLLDTAMGSDYIPRLCTSFPTQACGTWQLWGFQIPPNLWSIQNLYIIIKVSHLNSGASANVCIDDFSIDTYPGSQILNSLSLPYQNTTNVSLNTNNNWIIGLNVKMNFENNQCLPLGAFTFNHNGSTNPGTDVLNSGNGGVKLWWTGGTNFFSTTNAIQVGTYAGPAFPVASFTIAPVIPAPFDGLLNGDNFFWLTYDVPAGAVVNNILDADFISANLGLCGSFTCGGTGCSLPGGGTIVNQICSPLYPGWKIWLGYTDDWNVSANWCGGVPAINDDVLIPGYGTQSFNRGPGSYHPVIKSSVLATTKKLVILNDTVEVNSPTAGSLRISDSLSIGVATSPNTSALIVNSYKDTAHLSNGTSTNGTNLLFRGGQREKSQLMYKTAELIAEGMMNGDLIDSIFIPIRQRNSTVPWKNLQISYYYAQAGPYFNVNSGYTGTVNNISVAPINGAYPQGTVYTNVSINLSTAPWNIPASGGYVKIGLATPIQINTGGAPLIITICWEQGGATTPVSDQTFQTQTLGYRSYMQLYELGNTVPPAPAGCSMVDTTGYGWAVAQGAGFVRLTSDFRPNLTFKYHRAYQQYPVNMETNGATTSNWSNYGNFLPGNSIVTFNGAALQKIAGVNPTTFFDLKIDNSSEVKLFNSISVSDILNLQTGNIYLNSNSVSILNPKNGGIVRTNGKIISESNPPAYGTIKWSIGTQLGAHIFPFATLSGTYIPFTYHLTGGDVGIVTVGTYHTPQNNLPFPTGVTNMNDTNNVDNSAYTVDRFWHIENTGPSGKAKIKFTYLNSEATAPIVNGNINALRYISSSDKWKMLLYSMTNTISSPSSTTSQVLVNGVNGANLDATEWALADASSPLRLEHPLPSEIDVAPNPFTDKINISLNGISKESENISLKLYSMLGDKVDEIVIPSHSISNDNRIEWYPENINNGIYFLMLQTKYEIRTERVIKIGK